MSLITVPAAITGDRLETVEVMENHTAYLSCPVTGTPAPSIIWYKNGVPLFDADYPNLRQLNAGQQLEVRRARAGDEAVYKCQAGNVAGLGVKRFKLRVLGLSLFCFFSHLVTYNCVARVTSNRVFDSNTLYARWFGRLILL